MDVKSSKKFAQTHAARVERVAASLDSIRYTRNRTAADHGEQYIELQLSLDPTVPRGRRPKFSIDLSREQARELARHLITHADSCDRCDLEDAARRDRLAAAARTETSL